GASISTNGDNKALNRFNLREAELDIREAIAPFADGVLIIAIAEEIEEEPGGITVDTAFELEEGYINFHTLPYDLQLKAGKFRAAFGRNNLLHTHDLPQIDRPPAVQAFFGPEGLATLGVSTNWLVPNPWENFFEFTVEVVNADGGAESPILGGPNADNPAFLTHLKYFDDVGETGSFELGGSYLYARTAAASDFDANVFGLDLTYKRLDPDAPDFRSLLFQSEFFWASNDIAESALGPFRNDSFGMYAFAQYQFHLNWYTGVRFDYTQFPNSEIFGPDDALWAVSPYVTYYLSEFLRLRFEYQHREFEMAGDRDNEDNFLFGLVFSIGSHPPHPYWVNR
ncbi:MAG: porin, partial [Phycisphaerales bacterium]|nr:porin [Phycisphaerales bacterium]